MTLRNKKKIRLWSWDHIDNHMKEFDVYVELFRKRHISHVMWNDTNPFIVLLLASISIMRSAA